MISPSTYSWLWRSTTTSPARNWGRGGGGLGFAMISALLGGSAGRAWLLADDPRGRHFRPGVVPALIDQDLERAARFLVDLRGPSIGSRCRDVTPAIGLQRAPVRDGEAVRRDPSLVEEPRGFDRRGLDDGGSTPVKFETFRDRNILELAALRPGRRGGARGQRAHDRQEDEQPAHGDPSFGSILPVGPDPAGSGLGPVPGCAVGVGISRRAAA